MSKIISRWDAVGAAVDSENEGNAKLAYNQLYTIIKALRRENKRKLLNSLEYLEINEQEEKFFSELKGYTLEEIMAKSK